MDEMFGLYSAMIDDLSKYLQEHSPKQKDTTDKLNDEKMRDQAVNTLRPVLPLASSSTVGMFASAQSIQHLINCLVIDDLPEARQAGLRLLAQARKSIPALFGPTSKESLQSQIANYRSTTSADIKKRAVQYLPPNHADQSMMPVDLVDICPRNELHLVADMLYEESTLPLRDLQTIVNDWPYDKKVTVLSTYIGDRKSRADMPGRALEKVHYSWDIICDFDIFRVLQRHRIVDDLVWQDMSPRFGYDVPELIETAGLSDRFEKCFDISLALYSSLQQAGFREEAQYATLFGHKLRWKVTYNAREAFHILELYSSKNADPKVKALVGEMYSKIAESHPLIASSMKFAK